MKYLHWFSAFLAPVGDIKVVDKKAADADKVSLEGSEGLEG